MEFLIDILSSALKEAFEKASYPNDKVRASISNRPDLCAYQCNGAMAIAKIVKKKPIDIATEVATMLKTNKLFSKIEAVMPGFINFDLDDEFLVEYLQRILDSENLGIKKVDEDLVIIDFGGANIAKPLHVGHLRSAVIGESIKRILRETGHKVIGDAHLGDWGLQMGLIISQLEDDKPKLPYFDKNFSGVYPEEPPFSIKELEEIYPKANLRAKEDETFKERARDMTLRLQKKEAGVYALWQHILKVSMKDLQVNYNRLLVEFDLWKKESDAQPYIEDMISHMRDGGYTRISDGALVVDVKRDDDKKEIPPCMILKSNGSTLYNTTDLATIVEREKLFNPDRIIYVVDKRQELYFEQVFRCAKKTKLIGENVELNFLGFGTMNGKDGKPFKTRDGGVMRLQSLLDQIEGSMLDKINEAREIDKDEAKAMASDIAVAAIKYGDLSNVATKDYIFDEERFTSFEGETGPYILYTIVRIKSILNKYGKEPSGKLTVACSKEEKDLMLCLSRFSTAVDEAAKELAPHKLCKYIYELANSFNSFYHKTKILDKTDKLRESANISLSNLTKKILEKGTQLLGINCPERM